jgi:hypothetical protein
MATDLLGTPNGTLRSRKSIVGRDVEGEFSVRWWTIALERSSRWAGVMRSGWPLVAGGGATLTRLRSGAVSSP